MANKSLRQVWTFGYVNVKQGAAARKLPKNASGNEMWNSAQQASAKKISEPSLVCIKNKLCQINISETAWSPRIIQNCAQHCSDLKRNPEPFSPGQLVTRLSPPRSKFHQSLCINVKAWFLYFHPRVFLLQRKYIPIKKTHLWSFI